MAFPTQFYASGAQFSRIVGYLRIGHAYPAGLALRIWTFGHLEKNQHMITTGPYAHSRNPAYLGSFLIVCGFGLAAGTPFV